VINLHESSVEVIDNEAFSFCKSLKVLKLPPSVKTINDGAFRCCESLIIVNLSTRPLLEEIANGAFYDCSSLLAVHFPNSLQRIGEYAFWNCHSLIAAEFPPTVQVEDEAFFNCRTLELRQPQEVDAFQKSRDSKRYLQVTNDRLSIHKICRDINIIQDQLQSTINNNININYTLQQTDELGMTALHILCLNPNATPEMFKLLVNACQQAATMQADLITNIEYTLTATMVVNETHEMVTPIKLFMKAKAISYKDNDFDEEGRITLDTVFQKVLEWNDLKSIMSIQSFELGVKNESTDLYPFMQAATIDDGMNLETLYRLAIYNPKLIYELVPFETKAPKKRTQNV